MCDMWLHTQEGRELCVSEKLHFEKVFRLISGFKNIFRKVLKVISELGEVGIDWQEHKYSQSFSDSYQIIWHDFMAFLEVFSCEK